MPSLTTPSLLLFLLVVRPKDSTGAWNRRPAHGAEDDDDDCDYTVLHNGMMLTLFSAITRRRQARSSFVFRYTACL